MFTIKNLIALSEGYSPNFEETKNIFSNIKQDLHSVENYSNWPIRQFERISLANNYSSIDSLAQVKAAEDFKLMWTGLSNFDQQKLLHQMKKLIQSSFENNKLLSQQHANFVGYKLIDTDIIT